MISIIQNNYFLSQKKIEIKTNVERFDFREEDEQKIILPDLCRLLDDVALHRLRWTTIRNPDPEESLHVARPEVTSSANGPECMDRVQILKMAGNVWKTKLNGRRRLLQLLTSWTDGQHF